MKSMNPHEGTKHIETINANCQCYRVESWKLSFRHEMEAELLPCYEAGTCSSFPGSPLVLCLGAPVVETKHSGTTSLPYATTSVCYHRGIGCQISCTSHQCLGRRQEFTGMVSSWNFHQKGDVGQRLVIWEKAVRSSWVWFWNYEVQVSRCLPCCEGR